MKVDVSRIDQVELRELISSGGCGSLFEIDQKKFECMGLICNEIWLGKIDDKVACLWGLAPPTLLSEEAYIWLWTSPVMDQHKFLLIRASQRWIERALDRYPTLVGYTDRENKRAIQWIKWLGGRYHNAGDRLSFRIEKEYGRSSHARA